ncbi:MAG: DUF427 domain-containing protein [Nocardioides sp.]
MTEKIDKPVLVPGPDHPITVEPSTQKVTVSFGGRLIASTDEALVLQESTYRPVYYLPLGSVDASVLETSDHQTYCPYKGDASYYSLVDGSRRTQNAVWSYVAPYESVSEIAGRVAFYPHLVDITTE